MSTAPTPQNRETLEAEEKARRQPEAGSVARATGRVAWRWAGMLCYGTLIARSETASHCYARTQRGNTKTLTKGGTYWWQLE